jgi:hypothetical protein
LGDISEMRGLIVVICFLAGFFLLASLMPPQFMSSQVNATGNPNPNENLDSYNILGWNQSVSLQLLNAGGINYTAVRGFNVAIASTASSASLFGWTYAEWWGFTWAIDYFQWNYRNGTLIATQYFPVSLLDTMDTNGITLLFQIKNTHCWFNIGFTYDNGTYASPSLALADDELYMNFNSGFDESGSQMNAWTLLTGVIFFQPISGIPYYLSLLIAFPIWICIAYLMFIFVLRMIGAVFGGGGA